MANSILNASFTRKTVSLLQSLLLLISFSGAARSAITTYTDEATYLAALSAYVNVSESFEGNAWDSVRSAVLNPQTAPSITNLGLTWQHRFSSNGGVTTSDGGGNVHDANWQFYAYPHGGYTVSGLDCTVAGECGDGFTITSSGAGTLYGVGGWFSGVSGPEIKFNLDGNLIAGAGGTGVNTWQFFGVIDTAGFTTAEIWDSSGTGDDQNLVFADDFTVGATTLVSPPAGSLQFSADLYSVAENMVTAMITVTRVNGEFGTVGVDYVSTDGSATDGSDYTAVSGSLSFADGELTKTFTVPVFDDFDFEGDESVNLSLSLPTGGASLGSPNSAVLTITENDPVPPAGSLQFSAPSYTVAENGITATITVARTNGSDGIVSVDYATSDGSAMAGSDYIAVSDSLIFSDGVISQTFTVDIFDDADYEGDETINLSLSNPGGGAGLDSPSTAVLTIIEDDPVPPAGSLQFDATDYNVKENRTRATITVTRVGGSFGTVGVDYASSDDTATAGTDYTAVIGSLSFADGVTSQSFSINILDDTVFEGDESLDLALSNPSGGAGLGSPLTASLKIVEDDIQADEVSTGGSSSGSIDVMTLILLFSVYVRNLRIRNAC